MWAFLISLLVLISITKFILQRLFKDNSLMFLDKNKGITFTESMDFDDLFPTYHIVFNRIILGFKFQTYHQSLKLIEKNNSRSLIWSNTVFSDEEVSSYLENTNNTQIKQFL